MYDMYSSVQCTVNPYDFGVISHANKSAISEILTILCRETQCHANLEKLTLTNICLAIRHLQGPCGKVSCRSAELVSSDLSLVTRRQFMKAPVN